MPRTQRLPRSREYPSAPLWLLLWLLRRLWLMGVVRIPRVEIRLFLGKAVMSNFNSSSSSSSCCSGYNSKSSNKSSNRNKRSVVRGSTRLKCSAC